MDRSYSPYESIRTYQDRGMMKWAVFATGELTETQKRFREEQEEDKNDNPDYKKQ
ncbi:hypothetical protein [Lactococcus garvieae]|uniref:hypothetical protein n=1 Tax=Lactococcus garvieae TaxID=1363 RepID=UPI00289040C6|nr:hypothetical protein [Lactococcus garvieae]MDT2741500.1 hypothetical protein [Lactococcus garvieae]